MNRVIVVVEGGVVQGVLSQEPIDVAVLDHDWFEDCASTHNSDPRKWVHAMECEEHTQAQWEKYVALCREAEHLDPTTH